MAMTLEQMGIQAKEAARQLGVLGTAGKNKVLLTAAEGLLADTGELLAANEKDMERARENQMPQGL